MYIYICIKIMNMIVYIYIYGFKIFVNTLLANSHP